MASKGRPGKGKRVVFLLGHLHKGGMQRAVSRISCALPGGIEQYVAYFGTEGQAFEYRARMVDLDVPGTPRQSAPEKLVNFARRISALRRLIARCRPDTVVSFGEVANVLNALTGGKRTVLSVRTALDAEGLEGHGPYAPLYRGLIRALYPRADAVVAVSEGIADILVARYGVPRDRVRPIPNLFDGDRIREKAACPLEGPVAAAFVGPSVLTVGSLCREKGHEFLIRAFALARRRVPSLSLVVVGRGDRGAELIDLARERGVDGAVHFAGFDPNPYRYMARADLFVMTSRVEGFPNALVEAMICGLPVVATDCRSGPREILGDSEHGILLPAAGGEGGREREAAAADWMVRLLNPAVNAFYRRRAKARAAAFERERVVPKWLEVI
jgi:glycosyltransferase involved in cell wall biosynthesis